MCVVHARRTQSCGAASGVVCWPGPRCGLLAQGAQTLPIGMLWVGLGSTAHVPCLLRLQCAALLHQHARRAGACILLGGTLMHAAGRGPCLFAVLHSRCMFCGYHSVYSFVLVWWRVARSQVILLSMQVGCGGSLHACASCLLVYGSAGLCRYAY